MRKLRTRRSGIATVSLIIALGTGIGLTGADFLTFDELNPTESDFAIPNGYGGLHWDNFGAINGQKQSWNTHYRRAIASPSNVVFNIAGDPAVISSATPFDLHSAYLTAGVERLELLVEGFKGPSRIYRKIFTLAANEPKAGTFDFRNVDRVVFTPSEPGAIFGMDTLQLTYPSILDLGTIEVQSIAHSFAPLSPDPETPVMDSLIAIGGNTAGGGSLPSISTDLKNSNRLVLTLRAPAGKKFLVKVPPGARAWIWGSITWYHLTRGGIHPTEPIRLEFAGVQGPTITFPISHGGISRDHENFGFVSIGSSEFVGEMAFRSVTLLTDYEPGELVTGSRAYAPDPYSFFALTYRTTETIDPGPFVSIVPEEFPVEITASPTVVQIQTSQVAITWNSVLGSNYQVQFITSPDSPAWEDLGPVHFGTGEILEQTDDVRTGHRLYRIIGVP